MMTSKTSWILFPRPNPQARLRLFCFPYGGAGASVYRRWPDGLPHSVEVCAIQLPGRESRFRETPFTEIPGLVLTLTEVLSPYLNIPFAFFGHSLGAFVAFEVVRQLRKENAPGPIHLFVSGKRAPHVPHSRPPIYQLPEGEFIEEIRRRYDGIPQVVLQSPDLMQVFLPVLRADFSMNDTYTYVDGKPLECPISCFGGLEDPEVKEEGLLAWRLQTQSSFSLRMIPGGHFFIHSASPSLLRALSEDLTQKGTGIDAECSQRVKQAGNILYEINLRGLS
jgi:medium-chain acyl-[acyl-carrier-protein] hydrolase